MKTSAVVKVLVSLALILHFGRAQKPSDDSAPTSLLMLFSTSPQSLISLLLLVLTIILSGGIYLCVLRYVCIGCCEPIVVGCEPESLAGMV